MNNTCQKLLIAMTAAYVALLPQFYLIFDASNRFTLLWNRTQHLAILLAIAILGLTFFVIYLAAYKLIKPTGWCRRACDIAFVWLLCFILVRTVVALLDRGALLPADIQDIVNQRSAKLLYYGLIPLGLIALRPVRAKSMMTKLYCILSPLLAHVLIVPLAYASFDTSDAHLPDALLSAEPKSAPDLPNVYIFIFDDWSYPRTYPDGELWEHLPNLANFSREATTYHQAYSAGAQTITSIPRFIFQRDPRMRSLSYDEMERMIRNREPMEGASIFDDADDWWTVAISFYLDFPYFLEDAVDFPVLVSSAGEWSLGERVRHYLTSQVSWARYFGVKIVPREMSFNLRFLAAQQLIHPMTLRCIEDVDAPLFAFFHYLIPHAPYAWNEQGLRDFRSYNYMKHTEANYLSNLRQLDTVIGELLDAMRAAEKYDNSLIIFTSDHSWKWDPAEDHYNVAAFPHTLPAAVDKDPYSLYKHTVLLIKEPRQSEARQVHDPVVLWDIYPIIQRTLTP